MVSLVTVWFIVSASQLFVDAMHGGVETKIENAPYMAQLYMKYKDEYVSFCGASILSKLWIISAAHCVKNDTNEPLIGLEIRVGTNKTMQEGTLYNVSKIIVHEDYRTDTRWNNDLCLIKVDKPIIFNGSVQPIGISRYPPQAGNIVTATGYGYDNVNYQDNLKLGHYTVIDNQSCRNGYSVASARDIPIKEKSFCTDSNQVDLCGGDSGSPAVLNGKLVGVAVEGCEAPVPNIFVNLSLYYSWIMRKIR